MHLDLQCRDQSRGERAWVESKEGRSPRKRGACPVASGWGRPESLTLALGRSCRQQGPLSRGRPARAAPLALEPWVGLAPEPAVMTSLVTPCRAAVVVRRRAGSADRLAITMRAGREAHRNVPAPRKAAPTMTTGFGVGTGILREMKIRAVRMADDQARVASASLPGHPGASTGTFPRFFPLPSTNGLVRQILPTRGPSPPLLPQNSRHFSARLRTASSPRRRSRRITVHRHDVRGLEPSPLSSAERASRGMGTQPGQPARERLDVPQQRTIGWTRDGACAWLAWSIQMACTA